MIPDLNNYNYIATRLSELAGLNILSDDLHIISMSIQKSSVMPINNINQFPAPGRHESTIDFIIELTEDIVPAYNKFDITFINKGIVKLFVLDRTGNNTLHCYEFNNCFVKNYRYETELDENNFKFIITLSLFCDSFILIDEKYVPPIETKLKMLGF